MRALVAIFLFTLCYSSLAAQDSEKKPSRWSYYVTAGPNFYLNNFDQFKKNVDPVNFSFGARAMWEPEHRLSVGIKTGYYYIYRVRGQNAKITLTAIPIQTFATMKLYKGIYTSVGIGPSLYFNDIEANGKNVLSASWMSLADFCANIGYLQPKKPKKFSFGGELEFFYSSKSDENLFTLSFVVRTPF